MDVLQGSELLRDQGWFVCSSRLLGERILVAKNRAALREARRRPSLRHMVGYLPSCMESLMAVLANRGEAEAKEMARWLHEAKKVFGGGLSQAPPRTKKLKMTPALQRAMTANYVGKKKLLKKKPRGVKLHRCPVCKFENGDAFYPCRVCSKDLYCAHMCGFVERVPGLSMEMGVCVRCQTISGMLDWVECPECHGDEYQWRFEKNGGLCDECREERDQG